MSRSKKIFAILAAIFALFLIYIIYDISSRTTFPGSSKQKVEKSNSDSVARDSMP